MSDVAALSEAITALSTEVDAVDAAVASILAKNVAAGTPLDLSPEVAAINALTTKLTAAVASTTTAPPAAPAAPGPGA